MAGNGTLDLSIRIMGKVDPSLTKAVASTNTQVGSISKALGNIGKAGLAVTSAMAAATVGVIASTTKAAQVFEAQMADVAKYVDGITDVSGKIDTQKYEEMSDAILRLSTEIPYTAEELTRLAAAAGESGYGFDEIVKIASDGTITGFLYDVAMAGSALDISADQAGDWAAKWEVALGMTHDQVMDLFDQINYLAGNTATSAVEIATVVGATGSVGQIAGVDPKYTAALADALLSMGVDDARAATSVKNMYTNLSLGASATDRMQSGWQRLGMTAEGVASAMQQDAAGTMKAIFGAIGALPDDRRLATITDIFGRWPLESAAKISANMQAFTDAIEMVDGTDWQGSLEREFIIKSGTGEAIDQMFDSAVNRFMVTLGDNFLPVKKELASLGIDTMNGITDSLPDLSRLATSVMPLLRSAVEGIGNAAQRALPYVQSAIDHVTENGSSVARTLGAVVGLFAAMSAAPAIYGAGSSLLNTVGGIVIGGRPSGAPGGTLGGVTVSSLASMLSPANIARTAASAVPKASAIMQGAGYGMRMASTGTAQPATFGGRAAQAVSGAGVGIWAALKNLGGLQSGSRKANISFVNDVLTADANGGLASVLQNTAAGRYAKNVGQAVSALGNTTFVQDTLNVGRQAARVARSGLGTAAGWIFGSAPMANLARLPSGGIFGKVSGMAGAARGAIGGMAGRATNFLTGAGSAIMMSPLGQGAASALQFAGAGLNVANTALGPVAKTLGSGFLSLLGMFGPAIAGVGTLIAVVSILGDHFEDIRGIVGTVFGKEGLATFDAFTSKIASIGDTAKTVYQQLQTPQGMQAIQQQLSGVEFMGFNMGDVFEAATPAIQTVMPLIQSFVGVFGQIADLGVNHIKPVLVDIFGFVTTQAIPAVMPLMSALVSLIGTTLVNAIKVIVDIVRKILPIVQPVILGIIELVKRIAIIGVNVVNFIIRALNRLSFTVPDWVPELGGKTFGFNLAEVALPQFANGGMTNGPSIAGEAGTEAVISFRRSVRDRNIETWLAAGRMLGVGLQDLSKLQLFPTARQQEVVLPNLTVVDGGNARPGPFGGMGYRRAYTSSNGNTYVYAPNFTIYGGVDEADLRAILDDGYEKFCEYVERYEREKRRVDYGT